MNKDARIAQAIVVGCMFGVAIAAIIVFSVLVAVDELDNGMCVCECREVSE